MPRRDRRRDGRLEAEGPTDEELQKAKDYLIGSYALGFDTSTKIAHTLAQIAFEGLGIDYIARRNALVAAVTQADIRRAADRTLGDGRLLVVIAGRPVFWRRVRLAASPLSACGERAAGPRVYPKSVLRVRKPGIPGWERRSRTLFPCGAPA